MTPVEQHEQAMERIRELRALKEAGIEVPWVDEFGDVVTHVDGYGRAGIAKPYRKSDAALIVAAVNLLPDVLDMAAGVLSSHPPTFYDDPDWYICGCQDMGYDPPASPDVCSWPCYEARLILTMLGVTP